MIFQQKYSRIGSKNKILGFFFLKNQNLLVKLKKKLESMSYIHTQKNSGLGFGFWVSYKISVTEPEHFVFGYRHQVKRGSKPEQVAF